MNHGRTGIVRSPKATGGGGGGSGTVTSVAAGDASVTVGGTPTVAPTIETADIATITGLHAVSGDWSNNSHKITSLANGSAATDALAVGQVLAANVIPVGDLVAGTAGKVLGGTGPGYAFPPGYEIGYDQITSTVNIASTTEATGTTIITCGAHTFDGTPVMVQFFAQLAYTGTAASTLVLSLFESSTQVARLWQVVITSGMFGTYLPVAGWFRFTPTAASHTYTITAYANSLSGTPAILAGAAGTATAPPAFVRFTKV